MFRSYKNLFWIQNDQKNIAAVRARCFIQSLRLRALPYMTQYYDTTKKLEYQNMSQLWVPRVFPSYWLLHNTGTSQYFGVGDGEACGFSSSDACERHFHIQVHRSWREPQLNLLCSLSALGGNTPEKYFVYGTGRIAPYVAVCEVPSTTNMFLRFALSVVPTQFCPTRLENIRLLSQSRQHGRPSLCPFPRWKCITTAFENLISRIDDDKKPICAQMFVFVFLRSGTTLFQLPYYCLQAESRRSLEFIGSWPSEKYGFSNRKIEREIVSPVLHVLYYFSPSYRPCVAPYHILQPDTYASYNVTSSVATKLPFVNRKSRKCACNNSYVF
jgi:hypothetical protein